MKSTLITMLALSIVIVVATKASSVFEMAPKQLESKTVMLYGEIDKDQAKVYFGQDTRGDTYLVKQGPFQLSFESGEPIFVRISGYDQSWEIDKVIPNSFEM